MSANRNIFQNGKILFLAKVIAVSNPENTYIYIVHMKFNCDSPKIYLKSYFLLHLLRKPLETWLGRAGLFGTVFDKMRCTENSDKTIHSHLSGSFQIDISL